MNISGQLPLDVGTGAERRAELAIWFDGASRGNGRTGARAAIGAVVRDPASGETLAVVSRSIGEETNNVAEYQALLAGVEAARPFPARRLLVYGDSALVIQQLRGRWKVKAPHLVPLVRSAREALRGYEHVEFVHVPRAQNLEADALANAALDADLDGPLDEA